jgi:proteic killer suppression protein
VEFADQGTEDIYDGLDSKLARKTLPRQLHGKAQSKLSLMAFADSLDDLRVPPSNHLEKLRGDRGRQYSIRINGQYRVCFRWVDGKVVGVEIVDYH